MTKPDRPIRIVAGQFSLVEMRIEDLDFWYRFMSDPRVARFLPDRFESSEDLKSALSWLIDNYDLPFDRIVRITLAIEAEGDARPIGWVTSGPLPEDESKREVGYAIVPEWWGRGVATAAATALLEWLRHHVSTEPIYATVDVENLGSIRVLEKCGFHRVDADDEVAAKAQPNHVIYVRSD